MKCLICEIMGHDLNYEHTSEEGEYIFYCERCGRIGENLTTKTSVWVRLVSVLVPMVAIPSLVIYDFKAGVFLFLGGVLGIIFEKTINEYKNQDCIW